MTHLESGLNRVPKKVVEDLSPVVLGLLEPAGKFSENLRQLLSRQTNDYSRLEFLAELRRMIPKRGIGQVILEEIELEILGIREKLKGEVLPEPVERVSSTIGVIRPEGNSPWKLRTLRAVKGLDKSCAHPIRRRPAEPARGVLFFDLLPAEATIELETYVSEKLAQNDELSRVAGIIGEALEEISDILESEEMMTAIGEKEDRTFLLTLSQAIEDAPNFLAIRRPPLNSATLDRLIKIITRVDKFNDLLPFKTVDEPLEPQVGQVLVALRIRQSVLPSLKRRQMEDLRTSRIFIEAYRSYMIPAGQKNEFLERQLPKLEATMQRVMAQAGFTPQDFFALSGQAGVFTRDMTGEALLKITEIHKKKIEIDELRRVEALEQQRMDQAKVDLLETIDTGKNTKGIPEIILPNIIQVKDILGAPLEDRDQTTYKAIQKALGRITSKIGSQYVRDYKVDNLTVAELVELSELLTLPASPNTVGMFMRRVLELRRYANLFPAEAAGLPLEKINQMARIFETGTASAKQTLLQGPMAQVVLAGVVRFEGLQFNNRRFRQSNLPEPFEKLPLVYLQTEIFLEHTVESLHAEPETQAALQNIEQFVTFDEQLKQADKPSADQRKSLGITRIISLLKDLRRGHARTGRLTSKQRRFVQDLCRDYQRKVAQFL